MSTNTFQLQGLCDWLQLPVSYIGPKNTLPELQRGHAFIVNMDNQGGGGGTHWVGCYRAPRGNAIFYFDSFGITPPEEVEALAPTVYFNKIQVQGLRQQSCGLYVSLWVWFMVHGEGRMARRHATFLHLFSDDVTKNDDIMYMNLRRLLNERHLYVSRARVMASL